MTTSSSSAKKSTSPAKAEAVGADDDIETVTFDVTVRGETISLTAPATIDDAPLEVAELFDDDRSIAAFMKLIGPAQAARVRRLCRAKDFVKLVKAWQEAAGLDG